MGLGLHGPNIFILINIVKVSFLLPDSSAMIDHLLVMATVKRSYGSGILLTLSSSSGISFPIFEWLDR